MPDSVLYFPFIEIQSKHWLKNALLVWDHVYRIVPRDYRPRDDAEMRTAVDADLVRSIHLEDGDVRGFTSEFLTFLEHLPYLPAGLDKEAVDDIHPEKIDAHLYPFLERYAVGQSEDGWIGLPREVARGYMFFLACQVARRRGLCRGTDDEYSYAVASYFSEGGNFDQVYDPEARGYYSSLVLEDLFPFDVSAIPMDRIVRAVRVSGPEKRQFRNELARLARGLRRCESREHTQTIVNDHARDLLEAKRRLKAAQGFANKDEVGSLMAVGLPVALATYSILGSADPFSLTPIAPSILVGAIAAYLDYGRSRPPRDNPSGAGYLVSLERRFAGKHPAFHRYMEEFLND